MNPKPRPVAILIAALLAGALLTPMPSGGQTGDEINLVQLVNEVTEQQTTILDNQAKIDAKVAKIAENVRLARIYAGRAGGKVPMKNSAVMLVAVAALFALALNLHSQGIQPKSPLDKLRELKAKNAELIQKQTATLEKLDEVDKQAEQMRFLTKRG